MKISEPKLKVIRFDAEDVIATSTYIVAKSALTGNANDTGYIRYNASMGPYDTADGINGWVVGSADSFLYNGMLISEEKLNDYKDEGYPYMFDGYVYVVGDNRLVFTKGASYYELKNN